MYKSVKSKLLQKDIPTMEEVPANSSLIFNGLCVIQQLPKGLDTFDTISEFILKRIARNNAKEMMFVTQVSILKLQSKVEKDKEELLLARLEQHLIGKYNYFFNFQGRKYDKNKIFKICITEIKYFFIVLVFSTLLLC